MPTSAKHTNNDKRSVSEFRGHPWIVKSFPIPHDVTADRLLCTCCLYITIGRTERREEGSDAELC